MESSDIPGRGGALLKHIDSTEQEHTFILGAGSGFNTST